jgi:hypothetical protein
LNYTFTSLHLVDDLNENFNADKLNKNYNADILKKITMPGYIGEKVE